MNRYKYRQKLLSEANDGSAIVGKTLREKEQEMLTLASAEENIDIIAAAMFVCYRLFVDLERGNGLPFEHVEAYSVDGKDYFNDMRRKVESAQRLRQNRKLSYSNTFIAV